MIWLLGLSFRTAPIELRERVALNDATAAVALREITTCEGITEAMVVSTCNRTELFFVTEDSTPEGEHSVSCQLQPESISVEGVAVRRALQVLRLAPGDVGHVAYLLRGREAINHLFRVASSLDSLVIGEPQILGQLKRGFERAKALRSVGPVLHRLAMRAFRAAKRVRAETTIGSGQVSVATVALDLARQIFDTLAGRKVALIGTGEMGEAVAQLFQRAGADLIILGRNEQRVSALASRYCAKGRSIAELERTLAEVCVVVTSTSATMPLVTVEQVRAAQRRRRGRDLFIVDVAVPRDVEEKVGGLDGVYLYNVDDLSSVVAGTQASRLEGSRQAELIIAQELDNYERREEVEQVTPTVRDMYTWYSRVLEREVNRSLQGKLQTLGATEQQALRCLVDAATKKLLHHSATTLKRWAVERSEQELQEALELARALLLPADLSAQWDEERSAPRSVPSGQSAAEANRLPSSAEEHQ